MFRYITSLIPAIVLASCAFGEVTADASDVDGGAGVRFQVTDPQPGWRQLDAGAADQGSDAVAPPSEKPIAEPCVPATSRLIGCLALDCPDVHLIEDGLADIIRGECEEDLATGVVTRADLHALAVGDGCDGPMAVVVAEARDGMLGSFCEDGPLVAVETCEAICRRLGACGWGDTENNENGVELADDDPACVAECAVDECMAPIYTCFAETDCGALPSCFDVDEGCWSGGL